MCGTVAGQSAWKSHRDVGNVKKAMSTAHRFKILYGSTKQRTDPTSLCCERPHNADLTASQSQEEMVKDAQFTPHELVKNRIARLGPLGRVQQRAGESIIVVPKPEMLP